MCEYSSTAKKTLNSWNILLLLYFITSLLARGLNRLEVLKICDMWHPYFSDRNFWKQSYQTILVFKKFKLVLNSSAVLYFNWDYTIVLLRSKLRWCTVKELRTNWDFLRLNRIASWSWHLDGIRIFFSIRITLFEVC